jgi:hypothetical protein
MIARHVGQYGYVCPGDGPEHPAHPTRDLTLDHVRALIDGGAPFDIGYCSVLCRSCNSTKGASDPDRGSPHVGSALLEDRASQSCARGRVSPFLSLRERGGGAGGGGPVGRPARDLGQRGRPWAKPGGHPMSRLATRVVGGAS